MPILCRIMTWPCLSFALLMGLLQQSLCDNFSGHVKSASARQISQARELLGRLSRRQLGVGRPDDSQLQNLPTLPVSAEFAESEISGNDPNAYLFGDVLMTPSQLRLLTQTIRADHSPINKRRIKRKVGVGMHELWPKNQAISYSFHSHLCMETRSLVRQSITLWERNTCVRFKEEQSTGNRLEFTNGPGCASFIGMVGDNSPGHSLQKVEIAEPRCANIGTISHEIGHALGFYHEQSRPDRDNFIDVNNDNLLPNTSDNFIKAMEKYIHQATSSTTYDFGSVMHYSSFAFASNKSVPTIVPLPQRGWDGFQWTIGQRQEPSFLDYLQINRAYCAKSCPAQLDCHHGGYPNPNKCTECLCPSGFSGPLCEEVEVSHQCSGAGYLRVTTTLRVLSTPNYPREFSNDTECIWLLTAEPGYQIHYQVVGTIDLHCEAACDETFLEIKAESDFQRTGRRFCCTEHSYLDQKHNSDGRKMVIMLRNNGRNSRKGFQIRYWAQPTPTPSIGNICLFLEATAGIKPCRNGGTCIPFGAAAAFHCQCQPGFTGFTCQIDINECENSPCRNGATCLDRVNSYQCVCPESFTGSKCEHKIDACASDPCKNEGRCQNNGAGFVCSCAPNFAGPTCQLSKHWSNDNGKIVDDMMKEVGTLSWPFVQPVLSDNDTKEKLSCANESVSAERERVDAESRCGWLRETARLASICHNGGTCEDTGDDHQCHCAPDFTGPRLVCVGYRESMRMAARDGEASQYLS